MMRAEVAARFAESGDGTGLLHGFLDALHL
jgi:hypothetical protein